MANKRQFKNPTLAGICRNAFEKNEAPPLINADFIQNGIKDIDLPKNFKEKCRWLLKYLYNKGGVDFKPSDINTQIDYPICFADDPEEFQRIMEYLEKNCSIEWKNLQTFLGRTNRYYGVLLTDYGINEVEKELPSIPMIGLVNQKIATGDIEIDEQINHAKNLFFKEPQTFDNMRSACETLSFVLEPLRKELKEYFTTKDIEDFFQIVNAFDVRHNKDNTKTIEHPEQLEWIFYSLLNTVNTYTKLKKRL